MLKREEMHKNGSSETDILGSNGGKFWVEPLSLQINFSKKDSFCFEAILTGFKDFKEVHKRIHHVAF